MAATAASTDASQDAKPMNEAARPAAPVAETVGAAGTQLAALAPDEICQRDRDRLARLRASPSGEEAQRFTSELGCLKLLPQVLDLMGRSARTPYAAEVPNTRSSGTSASSEAVPPAPAAEPSPPRETAEGEQANLDVQLEGKPFGTATRRPVEITQPPKRADTRPLTR